VQRSHLLVDLVPACEQKGFSLLQFACIRMLLRQPFVRSLNDALTPHSVKFQHANGNARSAEAATYE
jgi:hypothetical protein